MRTFTFDFALQPGGILRAEVEINSGKPQTSCRGSRGESWASRTSSTRETQASMPHGRLTRLFARKRALKLRGRNWRAVLGEVHRYE